MRFTDLKDSIWHVVSGFTSFAFPFIRYSKANKKILERIRRIDNDNTLPTDFQYIGSTEGHKIDVIQNYFDKTIDTKKSLEEKSRAILLSITVSTSLIFGLLTVILGQSFAVFNSLVRWFIVILGSLSIIYMVMGAVWALAMLGGKIQIYQLYPNDEKQMGDDEKCKMLAVLTEQNANMNIIRSNTIYTCYMSTIDSLILLGLLFVSLCFISTSINDINKTKTTDISHIMNQVKSAQSSLESIYHNIEVVNKSRESEKIQMISIFSKSIEKIEKIGSELDELRKKNAENQLLIDKAKKDLKSPP